MLYFAYGSNMCTNRLRAPNRVPSAEPVSKAKLTGHVLRFHKLSEKDCSAKADAFYTGEPGDAVWGVIFRVDPKEKKRLDLAEGLSHGYGEKEVVALGDGGKEYPAVVYIAEKSHIQALLLPYSWYKRFVVEGARQHELPPEYIETIEAISATEDPDRQRDADNRALACPPLIKRK